MWLSFNLCVTEWNLLLGFFFFKYTKKQQVCLCYRDFPVMFTAVCRNLQYRRMEWLIIPTVALTGLQRLAFDLACERSHQPLRGRYGGKRDCPILLSYYRSTVRKDWRERQRVGKRVGERKHNRDKQRERGINQQRSRVRENKATGKHRESGVQIAS